MKLADLIGQGVLSGYRAGDYLADRADVLAYIKRHGPCSAFDLELCLHQEQTPVMRHLAGLLRQGQIETCYFGGEKFRAIP